MRSRAKLAREQSGLSLRQAAKMLDVDSHDLLKAEEYDAEFDGLEVDVVRLMCDVYGVNEPWLRGDVDRYDRKRVDEMAGADKLTFHDRDVIAEFVASMPRGGGSFKERVERIRDRRKA